MTKIDSRKQNVKVIYCYHLINNKDRRQGFFMSITILYETTFVTWDFGPETGNPQTWQQARADDGFWKHCCAELKKARPRPPCPSLIAIHTNNLSLAEHNTAQHRFKIQLKMISQFFVLSQRGDNIVFRDCLSLNS